MTGPGADAARLARELEEAAAQGFDAWNQALADHLDDSVEIRHAPPAPDLDGRRSRVAAIAYLRAEAEAFPRAFTQFELRVGLVVSDEDSISGNLWYRGVLGPPQPVPVSVGFGVELGLSGGRINLLAGSPLAETSRRDLVAWLKAVEAAGGFHPPRAG